MSIGKVCIVVSSSSLLLWSPSSEPDTCVSSRGYTGLTVTYFIGQLYCQYMKKGDKE